MKFAKELEQELVPEWRVKYLDYKAGKKYIKAVSRAINRANNTPLSLTRLTDRATPASGVNVRDTPFSLRHTPRAASPSDSIDSVDPLSTNPNTTAPLNIPGRKPRESDVLARSPGAGVHYGSFVPTPRALSPAPVEENQVEFELPAPAIRVPSSTDQDLTRRTDTFRRSLTRLNFMQRASTIGLFHAPVPLEAPSAAARSFSIAGYKPNTSSPHTLRRLFTSGPSPKQWTRNDINLQNFDVVREREREFLQFLDSELDKIEKFYRQKEEHAGRRLEALRDQLHEMRNRRIDELDEMRRAKDNNHHPSASGDGLGDGAGDKASEAGVVANWVQPIRNKIFRPGPNSKALQTMTRTPVVASQNFGDARRDYIRRPVADDVSYRTAKRKLKLALQEFYRGLELLKSYALLNRTAFRKLNKKYDKAVNARPPYRYLNEHVNKAWFVESDVLDGYIQAVEDIYARYFERGNHKIAVGKLRSLDKKRRARGDAAAASAFWSGAMIGAGLVFAAQGLTFAVRLLYHPDAVIHQRTSYLLQIYGGYFLMLLLFLLFCVNCGLWERNRINYPLIFELDPRHHLDWREMLEIPSFLILALGLVGWLNFSRYGSEAMFLYYPVLLIGATLLLIFFPAPVLKSRSRSWFAYSHWRLLLAGLYPVEFRDFFLGDMYCSLTYATCNVELFFCLYATSWEDPPQCNSSHSRLLGFFSALPPIWRFLQCIRRYHDTHNAFPHLANCGKYTMSIIAAVTLSLYRIDGTRTHLSLFIAFATMNAIYCSLWDLFMDFSLLQPHSKHRFLRDILSLKYKSFYHVMLVLDPVLRFSWIFYAIFTYDVQHSTLVSFLVAVGEVVRRGLWALLRVENEHSANVAQYKASRDVPLPYHLDGLEEEHETTPLVGPMEVSEEDGDITAEEGRAADTGRTTGVRFEDSSTAEEGAGSTLRRRNRADSTISRSLSQILARAHTQDFEKRRKPAEAVPEDEEAQSDDEDSIAEEENDEEAQVEAEAGPSRSDSEEDKKRRGE